MHILRNARSGRCYIERCLADKIVGLLPVAKADKAASPLLASGDLGDVLGYHSVSGVVAVG